MEEKGEQSGGKKLKVKEVYYVFPAFNWTCGACWGISQWDIPSCPFFFAAIRWAEADTSRTPRLKPRLGHIPSAHHPLLHHHELFSVSISFHICRFPLSCFWSVRLKGRRHVDICNIKLIQRLSVFVFPRVHVSVPFTSVQIKTMNSQKQKNNITELWM